ncbi:hypothetical protein SSCG_00783 [Streptomyces clavuligerus]|nr:hypothetical protein SSCG_00783 [Streptomyces clavuligerus]
MPYDQDIDPALIDPALAAWALQMIGEIPTGPPAQENCGNHAGGSVA